MIIYFVVFFGIASMCTVLQTNIPLFFSIAGLFPIPDLAFIVLVYISFIQGEMMGQVLGFTSGVVMDCLSLSPFGFNAFVHTVMGHIVGRFKGVILLDTVFLPIAVVAIAFFAKTIVCIGMAFLLGQAFIIQRIVSLDFLLQFVFTILLSPFVFYSLKGLSSILLMRKAYH